MRDKLYFSFSIPTPGFPHFYYILGANLGLLLYGEVFVMTDDVYKELFQDKEQFDNSDYPKNSAFFFDKNKKVIGKNER